MADWNAPPGHRSSELVKRRFIAADLVALRHQVRQGALDSGLTGVDLYRFVVAVNEVATNAVRHGGGTGQLDLWRAGDRLHCRVTDQGGGLGAHRPSRPDPYATSGRGLWLAQHGSTDLAIDTSPAGTTVTLTSRALPPSPGPA